jgi:hypothetical protein
MQTMSRFFKLFSILLMASVLLISCEKEYSLENSGDGTENAAAPGTTSGTSLFVTSGGSDSCIAPTIRGTYKAGVALDTSNTVTIRVNVTRVGTYTITTATANGIYFSGSGTFTTTGLQTVVLQGSGTPIQTGRYNYMAGFNSCTFAIIAISGGGITTNCKACAYIPMCNGSSYTYVDTLAAGVNPPLTQNLTYVSDTLIDGKIYQKFAVSGSTSPFTYYNCTAGVSSTIQFNGTSIGGVTVPRIDQTLLKANSPVGTTWQNTVNLGSGVTGQYDWSIVAKGVAHTVLGTTYPDCIQVHLVLSSVVPMVGTVVAAEADYYYAKNVGLVDNINLNATTTPFTLALHRVLQSYFIP